jgi:methylmalonyl-CoA mutase cobalamin-binding domain/chain
MPKKILVVDDSALMRRVLCDIIDTDIRFQVADRAKDGLEAFDLLSRNSYDAVVLDVNMPRMNGLQLLQELRKYKIPARVMMASTDTKEGARTTLDALELGALDFVHKPDSAVDCRGENFRREFLRTLNVVANSKLPVFAEEAKLTEEKGTVKEMMKIINHHPVSVSGSKVVAIASSTGGPKSLQSVIPLLPANLDAPVLVVQHMPVGFTASLAERLDNLSQLHVKEAAEGEELKKGTEPSEIIDKYLIAAINYVGELFEQKKYFLPQLIASAETMEKAINRLEPLLEAARGNEKLATIVVATVKGDIHDIGKNLVALMLKNYGYHVIDLGKDVETQTILDTAKAENASIIGLSALMTTTMMEMKEVVDEAKRQGVKAKIIIGGAVVTESFAEEIGADGYSADAREAVKVVNRLLEK